MQTGTLLLAGDIGGTKTKLALYEHSRDMLLRLREQTYASGDYAGLETIVADFIAGSLPSVACFGVAGPVKQGLCRTTNLPWLIEESSLSAHTGIPVVRLLNDLQAMALGLVRLGPGEWVELNHYAQPDIGNIAVIAAGTGCGEAILYWDGQSFHAIATEGGHADFAPTTREQEGLLRYLRGKFGGHVSYERILSGQGLYNVYLFLREEGFAPESAVFRDELLAGKDPGKLISHFAQTENDLLCREALRMFCQIYGAEAGNLALKTLAQGGVLIGGGIAAKNLPAIANGDFMASFRDKGRFSDWLGTLSVKVALNEDAGLLGAAHTAASLTS